MFSRNNLSNIKVMKGFTLVELLIVIAILAVLAAAVVIVINPGQMLAQARDAQRMSDLTSVRDALVLFVTHNALSASPIAAPLTACAAPGRVTATGATPTPFGAGPAISTSTVVTGGGWVNVNFATGLAGFTSPISTLPIDPINNATHFYAYACDATGTMFELNTRLESTRHSPLNAADGGNQLLLWEIGTVPGLTL